MLAQDIIGITIDRKTDKVVQRNSHASTVEEVLAAEGDIRLYLFIPPAFRDYAATLIDAALKDRGLTSPTMSGKTILYDALLNPPDRPVDKKKRKGDLFRADNVLVCWRMNAVTAWQQIDRRIDECV